MNERICELKEAAMEVTFSSPSTGREQKQLNVDKFAELIVRECAQVSERTGSLNEADYEGEMIADAIKEHFGVLE